MIMPQNNFFNKNYAPEFLLKISFEGYFIPVNYPSVIGIYWTEIRNHL